MGVPTSQQQQQQQQQQQLPGPARAALTSRGGPGGGAAEATTTHDRVAMEREIRRREEEKFDLFTKFLMKYLQQKDPAMHAQVTVIMKDCAKRNKRQEPGYESLTASMKKRLKEEVGENYWKQANFYLTN
jgi:hypothetical protein